MRNQITGVTSTPFRLFTSFRVGPQNSSVGMKTAPHGISFGLFMAFGNHAMMMRPRKSSSTTLVSFPMTLRMALAVPTSRSAADAGPAVARAVAAEAPRAAAGDMGLAATGKDSSSASVYRSRGSKDGARPVGAACAPDAMWGGAAGLTTGAARSTVARALAAAGAWLVTKRAPHNTANPSPSHVSPGPGAGWGSATSRIAE
mmetsp:Transcript_22336/g.37969  ORF Transcript_22336/g.37969 Transcript_22336/m.37969 type:complete len:202 (-) Transcript_22336:24-629(-)|eukprot:CAMPEP_0174310368 /NCGR_PEP_ID=MMETSP0810-20121108/3005_1 /TAXON_ID=73025 ORGANISM="Eutreptiella gymnastica-like, Strain CCMP1594" /NCGR_SAMPLE_ID=MMETSP0810 /ASSEMBLY_ACC=CAM_ASM_000659 /LENGTH=201 /DNA_ID=CAMNT_0015418261 /DNA_START=1134 /DNA_END=1739 /DNA_ORIENTATION=+